MAGVLADWTEEERTAFGSRPLRLGHSLSGSPLFDDDALEQLIDATPRDRVQVGTMHRTARDPASWREGDLGSLGGRAVLDAVRRGFIWVHLRRVHETDARYRALMADIFAEWERRLPGLRTYRHSMSVLVSSPGMNVAYHVDVPGQSLWQVRGEKRVWIYPPRPPFLPQAALEDIILKRAADTALAYEDGFDDHAACLDLAPGTMATWPLNAPHRVVNGGGLSVSFTLEHWTDALRAAYAVNYANGLIRRATGRDAVLSQASLGPGAWAKLALAGLHKLLASTPPHPARSSFRVDPAAAEGIRDTAPGARAV